MKKQPVKKREKDYKDASPEDLNVEELGNTALQQEYQAVLDGREDALLRERWAKEDKEKRQEEMMMQQGPARYSMAKHRTFKRDYQLDDDNKEF